jgi:hypothetical protein
MRAFGGLAVALQLEVERATLAVARLDERLACIDPALADGVRGRAHLREAQALVLLAGDTVSLEDLVLHEAGMDVRPPATGTVRAARFAAERRSLARRAAETVLSESAIRMVLGESLQAMDNAPRAGQGRLPDAGDDGDAAEEGPLTPPDDETGLSGRLSREDLAEIDRLIARSTRTLAQGAPRAREHHAASGDRLAAWLDILAGTRDLPGALAVAVALDAWLALEPSSRHGHAGFALAATVARARGLALHHLPALALAYRNGRDRWGPHLAHDRRLSILLSALERSAALARSDIQRLGLSRLRLIARCEGRRQNARLPKLVDLFIASPIVSIALAADRLGVTPQAIEAMFCDLGPALPRELTGRRRYRAWGIV